MVNVCLDHITLFFFKCHLREYTLLDAAFVLPSECILFVLTARTFFIPQLLGRCMPLLRLLLMVRPSRVLRTVYHHLPLMFPFHSIPEDVFGIRVFAVHNLQGFSNRLYKILCQLHYASSLAWWSCLSFPVNHGFSLLNDRNVSVRMHVFSQKLVYDVIVSVSSSRSVAAASKTLTFFYIF